MCFLTWNTALATNIQANRYTKNQRYFDFTSAEYNRINYSQEKIIKIYFTLIRMQEKENKRSS